MAKPNILVVDSDEGFGFMLKDGLQNTGQYTAVWAHTGSDALQAVIEQHFDLVIVDSILSDMKPAKLIKAMRDAKNGVKIMVIPVFGNELPKDMAGLEINGVLPKPFFVGDLPELVDTAMGRARQRTPSSAMYPVQPPTATQPVYAPKPAAETAIPSSPPTTPPPQKFFPRQSWPFRWCRKKPFVFYGPAKLKFYAC